MKRGEKENLEGGKCNIFSELILEIVRQPLKEFFTGKNNSLML